ncbi:MAG: hypothetical protein ACD_51C00225G0008 [uncultured bacterium]|nr:MAG: hypothetical protein ACD_51C00225G0008 [uncultured bacterium]
MYYLYILKSGEDNRLYIGQTKDVEKRLLRHNLGMVKATRNRRPFELIFCKEYVTRKDAVKIERYLKSLKGGVQFNEVLKRWGVAKW